MPLALTAKEWLLLATAIVPAVAAVLVVWFVWRWAKRDEAEQQRRSGERG